MPISVEYRPAITQVVDTRVELDGWAAGAPETVDAQGTKWLLDMKSLDTWHSAPSVRLSQAPRVREHGVSDGPAFLDARVLTISGSAVAVDRASAERARDIITSVAGDGALSTLIVYESGRPTRQVQVRRSAETKTSLISDKYFDWSMVLVAPDPRRYAAVLAPQVLVLPVTTGGLTVPITVPITVAATVIGGRASLTNAGTAEVGLTLRIDGPVQEPRVSLLVGSVTSVLRFALTLGSGQWLDVDTARRTVYMNGTASRRGQTSGQWPTLPPGTAEVAFDAAVYDAAAQLTVSWRDGWW